jgi:hypothetical protein
MQLPDNIKATITIIRKKQEDAVKLWEALVDTWFKFHWEWKYTHEHLTFKVAYNNLIAEEFQREVKFDEINPIVIEVKKPKRKKKIKQNIKKK